MDLPVLPPVAPMLARLARSLPAEEGYLFEPKWDGFRCLAFRDGPEVDLRSRHGRPFARYFPELVEALSSLPAKRFVLDGEILVLTPAGADFAALMLRTHPAASRVERLSRETPASYMAFDVLAVDDRDLRDDAFADRRVALERLLAGARPPLVVTASTSNYHTAAAWLEGFAGGGVDGVMAKHRDLRYQPGRRPPGMVKVKRERTADCVVAGFRWAHDRPVLGSLLLGLHDPAAGELRHVGVCSSFTEEQRGQLLADVRPLVVALEGHPWEHGFNVARSPMGRLKGAAGRWVPGSMVPDWVPLAPELVAEAAYDQLDGQRFRHPARFVRWRPDREAASCTFEQFESRPALVPHPPWT
ncbi:MAG: ATP-dependent DNA ligase [Actinomycetota bacterium]|nr:ATP-dependent DNA ligase [Actinomycetota bacterium]